MRAAGVSPAAAATTKPAKTSSHCIGWEANVETFSSLQRLAPAHTARGVDDRAEKDTSAYSGDTQIPSGSEPATSSSFTATLPVYFHVVTDGRTGWLSKSTVKDQINVLNLSFAGCMKSPSGAGRPRVRRNRNRDQTRFQYPSAL
jgi:hypothetical protein